MLEIYFNVEGAPRPWQRPRFNARTGAWYADTAVKEYTEKVRLAATEAMHGHQAARVPVIVTLHFYRKRQVDTRAFGDIDNLTKTILDAMNGIVYDDDARVVSIAVRKIVSDKEHCSVAVLNADFDSN
ncbi:MAG: RusA family crossover junction endodeoxyribonuclease [Selenomonadaceae bacterium]|nr:RusA family crossover junction endodeoxyribonuclease [Selenomonadaceae bacterium]